MKPFQKILIPTDGSENAKAAAAQGLALAKLMDAEVTTISVVDVGPLHQQGFQEGRCGQLLPSVGNKES